MARDTSAAWSKWYTETRGTAVISSVQLQEPLTDEIDARALKESKISRSESIGLCNVGSSLRFIASPRRAIAHSCREYRQAS